MNQTNQIISLASELGFEIPDSNHEYVVLAAIAAQAGFEGYSYTPEGNSKLYDVLKGLVEEQDNFGISDDNSDSFLEQPEQGNLYNTNDGLFDIDASQVGNKGYNFNNRFMNNNANNDIFSGNKKALRKHQYEEPNKSRNKNKSYFPKEKSNDISAVNKEAKKRNFTQEKVAKSALEKETKILLITVNISCVLFYTINFEGAMTD